ncbi:discoidin domain-containing protein [Bacillus sp. ILBB4]|nr:discoidin domain-containing protein [Bacillus sp. ILBB4]
MTMYLYDKYTSIDQWTPEIKSKEIATEFSGGWTFYRTLSYSNSVGYTVSGTTYSISNVPYNTIVYSQYTTNNSTLRKATALIPTGRADSMNLKATTYDLSRSFEATKKDFIETVTATDGTYPDDGKHTDGFYYVKKEIAPPLNKYLFQDGEEIKKYYKPANTIAQEYSDDVCIGGTPFIYTQWYNYPLKNAFDNDLSTVAADSYDPVTAHIGYDFGTNIKRHIRKVTLYQNPGGSGGSATVVKIQRSDDKSNWIDVGDTYKVDPLSKSIIELPASVSSRYWRIKPTEQDKKGVWYIGEVEMMELVDKVISYPPQWIEVGQTPATKTMFDTDGMTDLSIVTNEAIQQLISDEPELLCWTDKENANRSLNLTAAPLPQLLIAQEDIEVKELESVSIDAVVNQSDNDLKIALSGDSGENWTGISTFDTNDLSSFKSNGFSVSEFNSLSKEQLKSLCPNGKIRMAFYLGQANTTNAVEIRSVTVNERLYTMTPEVESLSVLYSLLEAESPDLYVSRDDGVTWQKIKHDELADLSTLPEDKQLRVKVVLSNGQELQALSYSWI